MKELKITSKITDHETQTFKKYLQEISLIPLIKPEEEVVLAVLIKKGDQRALDKLVKANLRFVVSMSKQYQNQGLSFADLVSEGNIGLIKAAQRFDETKGFKFISYAIWWIRQSILQALAEQGRLVRLPQNKINNLNEVNKIWERFVQNNEHELTLQQLADMLGTTEQYISYVSLDEPLRELNDLTTRGELLRGDSNPDSAIISEGLHVEICRILNMVSPREAEVLSVYFGLNGDGGPRHDDLVKRYGLTYERIRQIKAAAILKIQEATDGSMAKCYLD